jgi:hypothetical protein
MNTMQKVTAVIVLLWVSALFATAASAGPGAGDWPRVVVAAVASGLIGALLVVAFARGAVIVRLQKGIIVLAVAGAAIALARPIVPDKCLPGWQRRLASYPELRIDTSYVGHMSSAMAMNAVDSIISEHLLTSDPEMWRDYGRYVVGYARKNAVPIETVVEVIQRETAVLRPTSNPLLRAYLESGLQGKNVWGRRLDSLVAAVAWEAKSGRRRVNAYVVPADIWTPDWPARVALAAGELLAGFAVVIVLGLMRRKPRKIGETDHAA